MHYENIILAVSDCIENLDCDWKNIDAIALTLKPGIEVIIILYNYKEFIRIYLFYTQAMLMGRD
jgi:hypothetical protein